MFLTEEDLRYIMSVLDDKHKETIVMSEMETIMTLKSKIRQEIYRREDENL